MRAYNSTYYPGALDSSELDPCIAAETRLKKSSLSTKKKRTICLAALLAILFLLFLVVLIYIIASSGGSDESRSTVAHDAHNVDVDVDRFPPPSDVKVEEEAEESTTRRRWPPQNPTTVHAVRVAPTTKATRSSGQVVADHDTVILRPGPARGHPVRTTAIKGLKISTSTSRPHTTTPTTTRSAHRGKEYFVRPGQFPYTPAVAYTPRPKTVITTTTEIPYILQSHEIRESCEAHVSSGAGSGVYLISPDGGDPFKAYCLMEMDERGRREGWMVIQRRVDGELKFHNGLFVDYQTGFGDLRASHWLGLDKVRRSAPASSNHALAWTLRIELHGLNQRAGPKERCANVSAAQDWRGEWPFGLGDEASSYQLHVKRATGGNLAQHSDYFYVIHNGMAFSTADHDRDESDENNCATFRHMGPWWHNNCGYTALNGLYEPNEKCDMRYTYWYRVADSDNTLPYIIHPRQTLMMIRPRQ